MITITALYNEERDTDVYDELVMKHMAAMTTEGLHSKAAIAVELAYRDYELQLQQKAGTYLADITEQAFATIKQLEIALRDLLRDTTHADHKCKGEQHCSYVRAEKSLESAAAHFVAREAP